MQILNYPVVNANELERWVNENFDNFAERYGYSFLEDFLRTEIDSYTCLSIDVAIEDANNGDDTIIGFLSIYEKLKEVVNANCVLVYCDF